MSRPHLYRGGTPSAQPFTTSLSELKTEPKKKPKGAALARQEMLGKVKKEGYEAGYAVGFATGEAAGYRAGFDQAHAEAKNEQDEVLREFVTQLQAVHETLESSIGEWFASAERELETVAVQVAERLIGAQLQVDRSFIVDSVKEALQPLAEAKHARVRVNPFDSAILSNAKEQILAASASLRGIKIVDDATILAGCIVETERGVVDSTADTRLRLLKTEMKEAA